MSKIVSIFLTVYFLLTLISHLIFSCDYNRLVDWRVYMIEEAEALLHSSKAMNKYLKTTLTLFLLFVISCVQFGCMDAVLGTLTTWGFFFGVLFDNLSLLVSMVTLGLYTNLPDQAVQILGAMPFLLMIFFSTTFSPGAGVPGVKALRCKFILLVCMFPSCSSISNISFFLLSRLVLSLLSVVHAS